MSRQSVEEVKTDIKNVDTRLSDQLVDVEEHLKTEVKKAAKLEEKMKEMQDLEKCMEDMRDVEIGDKKDRVERVTKLSDMKKQIEVFTSELGNLFKEREAAQINLAQLHDKMAADKMRIQALQESEAAQDEKNEMEMKLREEALGMKIKVVGKDELEIVFTQIDEDQPDKKFFVRFFRPIEEKPTYRLTEYWPKIKNMDEIFATLNDNKDTEAFAISVRQAFIDYVAKRDSNNENS